MHVFQGEKEKSKKFRLALNIVAHNDNDFLSAYYLETYEKF